MEIKTIQKTDNSDDLISKVWKISRPASIDFYPSDLVKIDAPISDFVHLIIHVKCSILEREIFTSMNDAIIWAQTSRVNDPFHWGIDKTIGVDERKIQELLEKMKVASENQSQDNYRMYMPLAATTEFSCKISIRSLYKLGKYFEYLSQYQKYFKLSADEILNTIKQHVNVNLMEKHSKIYPLSEFNTFDSGIVGHFLIISIYAPIAFRAQIVRHSNLSISDGLLYLIKYADPWSIPIGKEIPIQICANVNIWKNILRSRSCWMAQYNLWSDMIIEASKYIEINDSFLPCKNSCPYNADAELRYTDKDPGAPCPKHAIMTKRKLSKKTLVDIKNQSIIECRPEFWNKIIQEISK